MVTAADFWAQHKAGCACVNPLLDLCNLEPGPDFDARIRTAVADAVAREANQPPLAARKDD